MRCYQQTTFEARDFFDVLKWNQHLQNLIQIANGGLQQENIPYNSLTLSKFSTGVNWDSSFDTNIIGSLQEGQGQVNATQSHWMVASTADTEWERPAWLPDDTTTQTGTADLHLQPNHTYTNTDGSWQAKIIRLNNNIPKGTFMRIPAREGMLHVESMTDLEFLFSSRIDGVENPETKIIALTWRFAIHLFVNNKMVATTGPLSAGQRKSWALAASLPVDTGLTEIDIRISVYLSKEQGDSEEYKYDNFGIHLFNSRVLARNQYR